MIAAGALSLCASELPAAEAAPLWAAVATEAAAMTHAKSKVGEYT